MIRSAKVASPVRDGAAFGVRIGGSATVATDTVGVRRRKREMLNGLNETHRTRFAANGLAFMPGEGRFVAPKRIEVRLAVGGTRRLEGERVLLNLGTHASIPDVARAAPPTHVEAPELERLPEHLVVLGGGHVEMELAQAFRRFGSRVTVLQRVPQPAPREDADVAGAVRTIFVEASIDVVLDAETQTVEGRSGGQVRPRVRTPGGERMVVGSDALVATGRTPNTQGIGLDVAGVALDSRGYVRVDERLETAAPGIWAMGECARSVQLTHVAFDDFRVVRDTLAGRDRTTRGRLIPSCMFVDPPLARVGPNETAARRAGIAVRVARLPMVSVLRAKSTGETRGFMKALVAARSDRLLGFAMLGAEAGEAVAVVQVAMLARLPYTGLRDAILTHPTMAEGLTDLFAGVP